MIVTTEIRNRVEARINECWAIAVDKYGDALGQKPTWDFRKRGRVAGTACPNTNHMSFNAILLLENVDHYIEVTVAHELAHVLDHQINGVNWKIHRGKRVQDHHGYRWQAMMALLGLDAKRCHSYDTTNARVKKVDNRIKHVWTCNCGREMVIGPKRHRKITHGTAMYWMRGCGNKHVYTYTHLQRGEQRVPADLVASRMTGQSNAARVYNAAQRNGTGFSEEPRMAASAPRPDPTFTPQPRVRETGGSKLDKCRLLFRENYGVARKVMIKLFVEETGATPAGAATYYAKIKKELGA